ncbi:MAG: hypothetical protein ACREIS_14360 [Nitrospiraceae bacterium]
MEDFLAALRVSLEEVKRLGFVQATAELERIVNSAWSSSSEMLGEISLGLLRLESRIGSQCPDAIKEELSQYLSEVRKVWPTISLR